MDALLQDLRFAFRVVRKTPAVSVATVVTLALGVGLNAGVFTILNGVMFRARVTSNPASFVRVQPVYSGAGAPRHESPQLTTRDYQALRDRTTTLDSLAAWTVVRRSSNRCGSGSLPRSAGTTRWRAAATRARATSSSRDRSR